MTITRCVFCREPAVDYPVCDAWACNDRYEREAVEADDKRRSRTQTDVDCTACDDTHDINHDCMKEEL